LLLSIPGSSFAQDSTNVRQQLWNAISRDADYSLGDAAAFFTAPLRFDNEEWFYAAGFLGGSALLLTSDEAVRRNLSVRGRASSNGDFWDIPTAYGSAYFACGLTLATYATGIITENEELRITGRLLGESLILSGMPTLLIKYAAGRSRPYTDEGSWRFHGLQWHYGFQSFPSGHATVAFALSTVLAERSDNIWARVGLYGLASLTALARVHDNQHWFSDVVVGAGLGLAAGLHVIAREEQRTSYTADRRVILYPSSRGLTVAYRIN
jgi:membrane-associated phospholipid phosphatase